VAVAILLQVTNTNPAVSQTMRLTAYEAPQDPTMDPSAAPWSQIAGVKVPLSAQAGTYVAGGSVTSINAQAVHYQGKLYLRLSWPDATKDDATTKVEDFSDAVAVEFPAGGSSTVPAICMGQADAAVNIWQWRADSQAGLQDPENAYPNALVDAYPQSDTLFYTARAAGNPYANPNGGAVQTLSATAFGQLAPLAVQDAKGFGVHDSSGWAVVLTRDLLANQVGEAKFAPGQNLDMAFAVWDGSHDERNGKKAVSQFVTLEIAQAPAYSVGHSRVGIVIAAVGLLVGVAGLGLGLAYFGMKEE
jgi:complex iron-sulfur molybdoenzyme family reductase subunit gamma